MRILATSTAAMLFAAGMFGQSGNVFAQQASFTCTEVIGFSQTDQWYTEGFIGAVPNSGAWQLRWYSGGSVDFWADPNFAGWGSGSLVTQCDHLGWS